MHDEGGIDVTEIETLQIIDRARGVVLQNIDAFRQIMQEGPAMNCYDNALYIHCAEQIAYYFGEYLSTKDDDEKLGLFSDSQLRILSFLSMKGYIIPVLLTYIINSDGIYMSSMDEVERSVQEVLGMGKIAEPIFRDTLIEYILSSAESEMWK